MKTKFCISLFAAIIFFSQKISSQSFSENVRSFITVGEDAFALTHVKLIDGTGGPIKNDQIIVVQNGRITEAGNEGALDVPAGIQIINCSGKTLIPGMVMMHEHMFYGESIEPLYLGLEMPVSFPRLYFAGGVTTMRTTGSVEPQTDLNIKNWINEGQMIGPDIDVTGPYIERAAFPIPEVLFIKSPQDAAEEVNYWAAKGCTSFKLYMNVTRADAKAAIDAAHKRGLKVTGHLNSVTYREAADLGIDNLEHGFLASSDFSPGKKEDSADYQGANNSLMQLDANSDAMRSLMAYLVKKHVAITSTLPVFEPYSDREVFPGGGDGAVTSPISEKVKSGYQAMLGKDSSELAMFKKEMLWEKQFVEMGGKLMAGVDPTGAGRVIPGYADQHSLELLVEAGFSVAQAVQICSLNAAEYLGRDKEIGTIAVGKKADMVLINGDIENNIRDVRKTETVFKNGVGFDSQKIFDSVKGMVGLH